jgi:serine/threonine-protein kinase HipA
MEQFYKLAEMASVPEKQVRNIFHNLLNNEQKAIPIINASFLSEPLKRNYIQSFQTRLNKLQRPL